jgi:predicted nucleic acid-binding protein
MAEFRATRARLIRQTIKNPTALKIWLYENQGVRRFDASNRFFLILVDLENLEECWKLKRNQKLLVDAIHSHLDAMTSRAMRNLRIEFTWKEVAYETYADALFVVVGQNR